MKKHTRKEPCQYCGVGCGSNHHLDCLALKQLKKQGRGYKIDEVSKINKSDLGFLYTPFGYQLTYKKERIGGIGKIDGVGSKIMWRTKRADAKMYKEYAELEIAKILKGEGRVIFLNKIKKLN